MTVAAHLQELIKQKKALANNLVEKGVQASEDEKFNTLVPKVLDISGGSSSEDISEELTKYSSLNDELESVINSLPDISEDGGSNGQPLEVNELPEVGVEGTFYKTEGRKERLWIYVPGQFNDDFCNLNYGDYVLQIVDDFPNDPARTTTFIFYVYYIKSINNLYVYYNDEWKTIQDIMGIPFIGIVEAIDKMTEAGMYIVSMVTPAKYLFENTKYTKVIDDTYKTLTDLFTYRDIMREITLPKDWEKIPLSAFAGVKNLIKVTIHNNIKRIRLYGFSSCDNLREVIFEENSQLEFIGAYAFQGCAFTSIEIPKSVTLIDLWAFRECSLDIITLQSTTPPNLSSNAFYSTILSEIRVPMSAVDAYKSATNWSEYADIIIGY